MERQRKNENKCRTSANIEREIRELKGLGSHSLSGHLFVVVVVVYFFGDPLFVLLHAQFHCFKINETEVPIGTNTKTKQRITN